MFFRHGVNATCKKDRPQKAHQHSPLSSSQFGRIPALAVLAGPLATGARPSFSVWVGSSPPFIVQCICSLDARALCAAGEMSLCAER